VMPLAFRRAALGLFFKGSAPLLRCMMTSVIPGD
jgi:hypothetical protein